MVKPLKDGLSGFNWDDSLQVTCIMGLKQQTSGVDDLCFCGI